MSISPAGFHRFRSRVDDTLQDFMPVTLRINGIPVAASGPGGRTSSNFIEGGEAENFRYPFRILRASAPPGWSPAVGASVGWQVDATTIIPMEIIEDATRPHEDRFAITCKKRRKP